MDRPIRSYILYRARHLRQMEREIRTLEERKRDIIDSSPTPPDGIPRGQGAVSNPTESKAIRLEKINARIEKLRKDIVAIRSIRDTLDNLDKVIYDETIIKPCDSMQIKSQLLKISYDTMRLQRGKILKQIAKNMGEYYEDE